MRKVLPFLLLALLLTASCTRSIESDDDAAMNLRLNGESSSAFIPGSVIVQLDEDLADKLASATPDTKAGELTNELQSLGAVKMERLYPDAGEWEPRHRRAGLHRWYRLTVDPAARPATKAAADFSAVPGVVYAKPERRIRPTSFFNDPSASRQWALYNDGSQGSFFLLDCDINVVPVWDNYMAGSSDVIVAVLDGGVQLNHPDLAAVCIPAGPEGSKCFITGYESYVIPADDHGTHVAGVIAAINNNGIGINGIAGGNDGRGGVRILSCAFMMDDPYGRNRTIAGDPYEAMVWAADHGAVISQNSWGYVYNSEAQAKAGNADEISAAIDYFIEYAGCDMDGNQRPDSPMKGGVVIFAAGNESWTIGWPAADERVIAVGAVTAQGTRSSYSNFGDWVDICAPGGDGSQVTQIFSTIAGDQYGAMMGTSMACPHVSGVAALIASYYGGPGFTNEMLKERLLGGASYRIVKKNQMIGPMVDALGSFSLYGTEPPLPASGIRTSSFSNSITLSWEVTADPDDKKTYGYIAFASTDSAAVANVNPAAVDSSVISVAVRVQTRAVGDSISATMDGLQFDTPYYAAVIAHDYLGHFSALSEVASIRTGINNPPEIKTEYTGDYVVKPFEKLSVEYAISDADGHAFKVEVDPGSEALTYSITSSLVKFAIAGNAAPHGKYTAHIIATDSFGASTDYAVDYEILENHAPVVIAQMPNQSYGSTGKSYTFDLSQYIRDEDGEQLSYSIVMTDQGVAHLNASGTSLVLTTLGYGLTSATLIATDACNASCKFSFKILIRDGERPIDLYPNPVVNTLNIRPGTEGQISVVISNKAGAKVWTGGAAAGPFDPLVVDMSDVPGGTYYVRIDGAGVNQVFTIAKK